MANPLGDDGLARDAEVDRRRFCSVSSAAMAGGLAAGYGTFIVMAGRYLYPSSGVRKAWFFVTDLRSIQLGDSLEYEGPTGAEIVIARHGDAGTADDFVALSNICPHLGCRVHWEPQNDRFFCPCHNGAFDPLGKAIAGPPAAAGQSLPCYPLKIEGGLLYIEVPTETVVEPWRRPLDVAAGRSSGRSARLADRGAGDSPSGEEA